MKQAWGLVVLALASTAFEGGGSPDGILLVHGLVAGLVLAAVLAPPPGTSWLGAATTSALCTFGIAVLVSASRAPYAFAAWLVVQDVAVGLAVLWLAARAPEAASLPARFALLAAAACQGGIAVGQTLSGSARGAGTFLNPNHLAAWATAVLLSALPPLIRHRGATRIVVLVLGAAALQAVVVGRSRGAALGLVAGVTALLLLRWSSLSAIARRAAVGGALATTLLSGALFAGRLREDDPYRWTRMRIWAAGVEIARGAPWLGCGPGQFPVAAAAVRFPDPVGPLRWDRSFSTPHSDVVRLPAEFGVPAALAVGLALALALSRAIVRGRAEDGLARASSLAAFVALAVQATVDDLTTRPAVVVLGAMLLGSAAARPRDGAPARALPRSVRLALATVGVVVFLAGDLAPWLAWRTLHGVPRRSDTEARLTRALALNPVHPDVHLRLAELRLRTGLRDGPDYARARREAEAAVRLSPRDARYRVGLARVEVAACHALFPDEATRARASANYAAAAALAPFDPWVPLEQGRFLLSAGDVEGALRAAERARELEPQALPPRLLLGRARLALGGPQNVAAARDLLGQAEMLAARHSATARASPYATSMLSLDLQESSALHRALDELR